MQLLDKAFSLDEVNGGQVAVRVPQPIFLDNVVEPAYHAVEVLL